MTLNGGGTSNFLSRSILKLKKSNQIFDQSYFSIIPYSSSLINFGLTDKNCSIAGIYVAVATEFCERNNRFFRNELDNGIINSFEVKLL